LVRIYLANGFQKTLPLNKDEIFNLSAGMIARSENPIFTLHYDGVEARLSSILDLTAVEYVDVDDKDLGIRDLQLLGYDSMRIWHEPSMFRKLYFKIQWFFEDRKKGNKNV
jgi:hypothetical protein